MENNLPTTVEYILNKFQKSGFQIYIVGGAVRDLLMVKPVTDWDFTTNAKPEEILEILSTGFYDNRFGTVGIPEKEIALLLSQKPKKINETATFEVTTMRKEGIYQDFRHPIEVAWTDKIEEDLARRDFTINAMAIGIIQPKNHSQQVTIGTSKYFLIDPFDGQTDLKNKLIRAVGDPDLRFQEDALRLMRAIRFAAQLGFDIENDTLAAIIASRDLIKEVSADRIRDELFKILVSPNPYIGIVMLREAGILQTLFPELEKTFEITQQGPKHARTYNIGEHSLLTLKYTPSPDPITRLAALIHDIGKPETSKVEENGNVTFYNHDVVGGKLALKIAQRLNLSKKQTNKLYRLVRWHLFSVNEQQTDAAIRRFIKNVGLENIDEMIALRIGDRLGGGTQKAVSWRMEKFKERIGQVLKKPFTVADLQVTGHDVMKTLSLPPGPKVGAILNELFTEVFKDSAKNNREYLLERIKEIGKQG